jgi:hypothetical protein
MTELLDYQVVEERARTPIKKLSFASRLRPVKSNSVLYTNMMQNWHSKESSRNGANDVFEKGVGISDKTQSNCFS